MIVKWFSDNLLKLNDEKCHPMVFGNKNAKTTIEIGTSEIKESGCEKLLGITFDKKLNFKKHFEDLCRKANQMSRALARLLNHIDPVNCPLVWMFKGLSPLRRISAIDSRDRQRNLETKSPFVRWIASELSMNGVSRGEFFGTEHRFAFLLALRQKEKLMAKKKHQRKHKVWVRKLFRERFEKGEYYKLLGSDQTQRFLHSELGLLT